MAILMLELRTGRARAYPGAQGGTWISAIGKVPAAGPLRLTRTGLEGDEVAHPDVHGGPDQAVLAYASEHYPLWRAEGVPAGAGDFGENLLLSGLTDQEACIGDRYAVGGAMLQVSHPRQPCATLAKRFRRKDIVPLVWSLARGGWYLRVLQEGWIEAGMAWTLLERPNPGATVARVLTAFKQADRAPDEARAMAALEGLTGAWSLKLLAKAAV
jgi:MOSC domain-containing protein YiiM